MLVSDKPFFDDDKALVERLTFALRAAEIGTWDFNLETGYAEWSPICKHLFGLAADAVVTSASLLARVHPDDRERVNRANKKAISTRPDEEHNITFRTLTDDGQQRWIQAKGKTYTNDRGEVIRFSGIVQDVSATVEARKQQQESADLLQSVFDSSTVGISVLKGVWNEQDELIDFEYLLVNRVTEQANNRTDLVGQRYSVAHSGFKQVGLFDSLKEVIETGQSRQMEFLYEGEGLKNWYKTTAVKLDGGVVLSFQDITRDIEDRQQLEAAQASLLQTNQRLSLALEAGRLGSYDLELATGLMDCNAQCKANYGRNPDLPFNFGDLMDMIHPEDRAGMQQAVAKALETRSNYYAEYRVIWPDGTVHWVKVSGQSVYSTSGQPLRIIGVTQDITAQRNLQEELEQQVQQRTQELQDSVQDLSRSNQNLQQFAYIASHDLQEPLRKIQSFGDILKTQYSSQLGNGIDHLQRMQSAASRMSTLIKDLLTYSRISTRQEASATVALSEVVQTVISELELTIKEAEAVINIEPLPKVQGNKSQLEQLFQNLVSNALKFRKEGTAPIVRIRSQAIGASDLPASVRPVRVAKAYHQIDISDNGIGFEEKYIDRIFQVFQRLHGKGDYAGTGIGLAICEKVATNHGGAITATSQPGQGATFSVYLPI